MEVYVAYWSDRGEVRYHSNESGKKGETYLYNADMFHSVKQAQKMIDKNGWTNCQVQTVSFEFMANDAAIGWIESGTSYLDSVLSFLNVDRDMYGERQKVINALNSWFDSLDECGEETEQSKMHLQAVQDELETAFSASQTKQTTAR